MKNLILALVALFAVSCGETVGNQNESVSSTDPHETDVQEENKPEIKAVSAEDIAKYGFKKYEGAWFDVLYPDAFKVEASQKDESNPDGYSSCFFVSPDEAVSFYVFGAQWAGKANDIAFDAAKEVIEVDDEKEINPMNKKRWVTYAAKDGSYKRSYEETYTDFSGGGDMALSSVIGLKYKDQAAYDLYKPLYQKFKESFVQYAD